MEPPIEEATANPGEIRNAPPTTMSIPGDWDVAYVEHRNGHTVIHLELRR